MERTIILLGERCSDFTTHGIMVDGGKQSSLCLFATSERRGLGLWAALYIYHDTHLRSSELWSNFENILEQLTLCNPMTPDSRFCLLGRFYRTPHLGMPLGGWPREQYVDVSCQSDVDRGCLDSHEDVSLILTEAYVPIVQYRGI